MTPQPSNWSTSLWPYCMAFSTSRQGTLSRKGSSHMEPGVNLLHVLQGNTPDHGALHDHCRRNCWLLPTKASQSTGTRLCWLTAPCPVTVHTLGPRGHLICSPTHGTESGSIFSKSSNYRDEMFTHPRIKTKFKKRKKVEYASLGITEAFKHTARCVRNPQLKTEFFRFFSYWVRNAYTS